MADNEQVYEYIDQNMKRDENILTVDFYFDSDVKLDKAIRIVDTLAEADTNGLPFNGHKPTIYTKSPHNEEDND